MKFLDLNGLTHFFGKVKTWAGNNYLSLNGGLIRGSVSISGEYSLQILETDVVSQRYVKIDYIDGISIGTHFDLDDKDEDYVSINSSYISAPQFKKTNGKSTQALIADGSVKEIGSANGIAGLDSNGYVPLSQLGNLDTTVAEVVTALPMTNIKKHIYLIKDTDGVTQDKYEEYIYTGDTSATYDASKWEKLGDFRATVDLKDYAKKSDAIKDISFTTYGSPFTENLKITKVDGTINYIIIPEVSNGNNGLMGIVDKRKLDGIADNANNYSLPTASSTTKGGITLGYSQSDKNYPVVLDNNGKAYVNVPWTDTNTTYDLSPYAKKIETVDFSSIRLDKQVIDKTPQGPIEKQVILFASLGGNGGSIELEEATSNMSGLMSIRDKNKLDTIAIGATADSAITTAEIDALFA
nr:MAG: hypothetical protein [Bacteriophage sp.]